MPEKRTSTVNVSERQTASRFMSLYGATDFPVVALGASAGGLDACRKFLDALPAGNGMAFILVQHLDPTHESLMVDLLAGHTSMSVRQATEGMQVERDHLYVIPPGSYLSVADGALHLSAPQQRHGARLPFDFLLHALAQEYGPRAICIVLSGTGADGSLGLKSIKDRHGLIIAQDPAEAAHDGMPQSAILTGGVDLVLPVAEIPEALVKHLQKMPPKRAREAPRPLEASRDWLPEVIELLRNYTAHDFTLYKPGTLQRRIERRMALASIDVNDAPRYLAMLKSDSAELDILAKDLLINVTNFFRDSKVFDVLADRIVPDLIRSQPPDHTLRIWIAGCSTGEEAYSLVMLFREQITEAKLNIKLQVFASDVDPDAVAVARAGFYPEAIAADVSPARLARFFSKEETGYRVSPELRGAVVFTIQDLLADPPFSRLDMVSCRNLLIYLAPEAQAKVISLFHFALRANGILLLGSSETILSAEGHFEVLSKPERLYRHIGRNLPGEFNVATATSESGRATLRKGQEQALSRPTALADICRRLVLETYAPAAVLINRKHECLYSLGPAGRYLQVAAGHPTHDVLDMVPGTLRTKLRSAIEKTGADKVRSVVTGGLTHQDGVETPYRIVVTPVPRESQDLLLICFVDEPKTGPRPGHPIAPRDMPRIAELERELDATRTELQGAIRDLELSSEEQKAINEEALSINEEFQSTNEELLTSKEELQSLNEELTALNSQLQETLERQRTTSDDLQNILYSTDVATLFLDTSLKIRFFTPATKVLFNVIASDVGRPLADLNSLAADSELPADARSVLKHLTPIDREVEARNGIWFVRRILPYRTHDGRVEGVVITFTDITERKRVKSALVEAKLQAELANKAKSRFLAVASHDLRQPLQTLALLQGLLARMVEGEKAQKTVARLDETLASMSGMLNALLDINQIEAGAVHPHVITFPINDLLGRLRDEFTYHAQSRGLALHIVPCGLSIESDPRLLEQMLRNLLSNALKFTERGSVLLGCRRRAGVLRIEVWDTGGGIPGRELEAIFDEYHQLENGARARSRGLGLGLSIVKRVGDLLNHKVSVRSEVGKGSVFLVEVGLPAVATVRTLAGRPKIAAGNADAVPRQGEILIVEDDPEVRSLLELALVEEGHTVTVAIGGSAALALMADGTCQPDLLLTDYNLPGGMSGLQLTSALREKLQREIPVIILTGDISTDTLREIALQKCVQLNKPVKLAGLTQVIQRLLSKSQTAAKPLVQRVGAVNPNPQDPVIFVVDDDVQIREAIRCLLEHDGQNVEDYATCEAFLEAYRPGREACLLIDAYLPGMSGLELLQRLHGSGERLPAIMITGNSDVEMAVHAMKAGALDFIEKPVAAAELLASVARGLEQSRDSNKVLAWQDAAARQIADLTERERQILDMVLAGSPSKNIAADLGISQRTVENHRASIMKKTGSKSLPALARLALAAAKAGSGDASNIIATDIAPKAF
jgi:two-component system, chemotaxis family, CheB/CheR fusion protein